MGLREELSNFDINDLGSATRRVKLLLASFVCLLIIFMGYYFIIKKQQGELDGVKAKESPLRATFLEKKALAINLDEYKKQMVEAEETFGVLLKQLPNESEIPDLLIDMTQVGLSRGLQFSQIRPGATIQKDFYAEKNVLIKAKGSYHQIAGFISDIAALPRIINVADFTLGKSKEDAGQLNLQATTKTYHYLEEDAYVSQQ